MCKEFSTAFHGSYMLLTIFLNKKYLVAIRRSLHNSMYCFTQAPERNADIESTYHCLVKLRRPLSETPLVLIAVLCIQIE